jgi:hypothetical protein
MQRKKQDDDKYWEITPLGLICDAKSMREAMMELENYARCFYQKDGYWGAIVFGEERGGFFTSVRCEDK